MDVMIEDFGAQVASAWAGLRSTTRNLVERALQSSGTATRVAKARASVPYDARSDWELSRLLSALDERAAESGSALRVEQAERLRFMAETCAAVLQDQTQSAEVFDQLVQRAHARLDYARIDLLADALATRFAPTEVCELARSENVVVRALAHETLAQAPTSVLITLLADPVDSDVARHALERKALEFESEDARRIINALEQLDAAEDDL